MTMDDLYRLLRTGHAQSQGIVDTLPDPMLLLDENLRVEVASRAFLETFKVDRDETVGQPFLMLGNGQWDILELRLLLEQVIPRSAIVIDYEVTHDFPGLGRRTMAVSARKLVREAAGSHSMLLVITDATDRLRREAAQEMLLGEVRHRMKNMMAVVHALARQTPTEGRTASNFRDDFLGRFVALADAEDIAFSPHDGSALETLVERTLAPYTTRSGPAEIDGDVSVNLTAAQISGLSLVLHELTTNSAKYGALSVPEGRLRVAWRLDPDDTLRLEWSESGGPPVAVPEREGYGTRLVEQTVTYSLGGQLERNYSPEGLSAVITIPL